MLYPPSQKRQRPKVRSGHEVRWVNGLGMFNRNGRLYRLFCVGAGLMSLLVVEPSNAQPAWAEEGAVIYAQRCSGCHGENLHNVSGGWSFDLRKLRPDEHDRFVDSVTSGKDNMPSWYGILKIEEIEAVWAYIRATVDK
jgi:mono/diheme cytochrome c family protein